MALQLGGPHPKRKAAEAQRLIWSVAGKALVQVYALDHTHLMRVLLSIFPVLGLLAACSFQEEGTDAVGQQLYYDAVERVEAGQCQALISHSTIALEAGYFGVSRRVRAIDINPSCEDWSQDSSVLDAAADAITSPLESLNSLSWGMTWFEGFFDPATRRASQRYQALPDICQRFTGEGLSRWPELIDHFLSEPDAGVIPAVRAASNDLSICSDAFRAAGDFHQREGDQDWPDYWYAMAANLPAGAGLSILDNRLSEAPHGPYAGFYRARRDRALFERVRLADFEIIAQIAQDAELAETLQPGYVSDQLRASIDAAAAAGFQVDPAWRDLPRDEFMTDFRFASLVSEWIREKGLNTATTPTPFRALAQACAPGHSLHIFGFGWLNIGADAGVLDPGRCELELLAIASAAGIESARLDLIEYDLNLALRQPRIDSVLLEQMGTITHDDIREFTLPFESIDLDLFDCIRPLDRLKPYWSAATPTEETRQCNRLMAADIAWNDFEALSALLPFETCDSQALASTDRGQLRPVQYAAQSGRAEAFECFAEAAILDAPKDYQGAARDSLLVYVYGGIRLGLLSEERWDAAGGTHIFSPTLIIQTAEMRLDHLDDWGTGPDPLEPTNRDTGRAD